MLSSECPSDQLLFFAEAEKITGIEFSKDNFDTSTVGIGFASKIANLHDKDLLKSVISNMVSFLIGNYSNILKNFLLVNLLYLLRAYKFDNDVFIDEEFAYSIIGILPQFHETIIKILDLIVSKSEKIFVYVINNELDSLIAKVPVSNSSFRFFSRLIRRIHFDNIPSQLLNRLMRDIEQDVIISPYLLLEFYQLLIRLGTVPLDEYMMYYMKELAILCGNKKSLCILSELGINLLDDNHVIHKFLLEEGKSSAIIRFLRKIDPNSVPLSIVGDLLDVFEALPYESQMEIFIIIEPHILKITDSRIFNVMSKFISNCAIGRLALKATFVALDSLLKSGKIFSLIYPEDIINELETISEENSIDGFISSSLLDILYMVCI